MREEAGPSDSQLPTVDPWGSGTKCQMLRPYYGEVSPSVN